MTSMRQVTSAQGDELARECALPPLACCDHSARRCRTFNPPCTLPCPDDMKFFETSARSGQNVNEAFITLATDVKERLLKAGGGEPQTGGINLGQGQKAPAKKGCC